MLLLLAIVPFWSSYILRLYAWQIILAKTGILTAFLQALGFPIQELSILYTQSATRIGLVHFLFPIITILLFVVGVEDFLLPMVLNRRFLSDP